MRGSRAISGEIIHSHWSPVMFFSVKPGFIVETPTYGIGLLTPTSGQCKGCKPPIGFSWTPVKNATRYEFILASDPELNKIITKTTTSTTAFEYTGDLATSTAYYWRVKAVMPVESDPSAVGTFILTDDQASEQQVQKPQPNYLRSHHRTCGYLLL